MNLASFYRVSAAVLVLVLAIVYSYRVWKIDPDRRSIGGAS